MEAKRLSEFQPSNDWTQEEWEEHYRRIQTAVANILEINREIRVAGIKLLQFTANARKASHGGNGLAD